MPLSIYYCWCYSNRGFSIFCLIILYITITIIIIIIIIIITNE